MQYIFLPYIICLLLPFLSKKIDEQQARSTSNITLCIFYLGFIVWAGFDTYIAYIEGYLLEQIAFYNRAIGYQWFLLALAPIFIGITIQLLWIKPLRKNKLLSGIIAIYLTAYFLTSNFRYIEYGDYPFLPPPPHPSLSSILFHSLPTTGSYLILFSLLYYWKSKK